MKHQTILNVKFANLQRRLKLPRCFAAGVLETLWKFTEINARDGDLSKFSADEIAAWLEWPHDATDLIDGLVETRWLDRDGEQLTVHAWWEHMPNWLKGVMAREQGEPASDSTEQPGEEPGKQPGLQPITLTQRNPTKVNRSIEKIGEVVKITSEEFRGLAKECNELVDLFNGRPGVRARPADRELVKKAVPMIVHRFQAREWLKELALAIRTKHDLKNPAAYWKTCLRKKVEALGCDLNEELDAIQIEEPTKCNATSESTQASAAASHG